MVWPTLGSKTAKEQNRTARWRYLSEIADFNVPALYLGVGLIPLKFRQDVWRQKTIVLV